MKNTRVSNQLEIKIGIRSFKGYCVQGTEDFFCRFQRRDRAGQSVAMTKWRHQQPQRLTRFHDWLTHQQPLPESTPTTIKEEQQQQHHQSMVPSTTTQPQAAAVAAFSSS